MLLHQKLGNTILMVTHDVDEAILVSDRIMMMTDGPSARIGAVLDVPFARPASASMSAPTGSTPIACSRSSDSSSATKRHDDRAGAIRVGSVRRPSRLCSYPHQCCARG